MSAIWTWGASVGSGVSPAEAVTSSNPLVPPVLRNTRTGTSESNSTVAR